MILIAEFIFSSYDGENFNSMENSKYSHRGLENSLANYRGKALVTGCNYDNDECSFKTEIMDMTTMTWSDGPDYPYGRK